MLTDKLLSFENNLLSCANGAKFPKSPLQYPGGKFRAVKHILSLIPRDVDMAVSPFVGGGSVELALVSLGVKVLAYDIFEPLVAFWQELIENKEALVKGVKSYYPLAKETFYSLQKQKFDSRLEQAIVFYVLNRASYSGATFSGGMSPNHPRFTESSIAYLERFDIENFKVKQADFKESISKHKDVFMYLDPPYMIEQNLYGRKGDAHRDFNHEGLRDLLLNRQNWILSYNNCDKIQDWYKDFVKVTPKWSYGMSADKRSRELIILSEDLSYVAS